MTTLEPSRRHFPFPHPLVLLSGAVFLAAAASWVLPAGVYDRVEDEVTGRIVAVAGTYHRWSLLRWDSSRPWWPCPGE